MPSNKRMQLTKRGFLFVGAPSRAIVIESRFAADPWCSADTTKAVVGSSPALLPLLTEQNRPCGFNESGFAFHDTGFALSPLKAVATSSDLALLERLD